MDRIVTSVDEAEALLGAPVVAFDVETDTEPYHWSRNHQRGLSYVADVTAVSLYAGPEFPTVVLLPEKSEQQYTVRRVDVNEYGEPLEVWAKTYRQTRKASKQEWVDAGRPSGSDPVNTPAGVWFNDPDSPARFGYIQVEKPYTRYVYRFSDDQTAFLKRLFEREAVFVAHNLVFDARQLFGKYGLAFHPGATFWDTLTVEILGLFGEPKENDLLSVYRRYEQLDEGTLAFLVRMKSARSQLHQESAADFLRYSAWDAFAAYRVYQGQMSAPKYAGFDDLLRYELAYTKWCARAAAEGVKLDVEYVRKRELELTQEWVGTLRDLGLTVAEESNTRKDSWISQYIFERVGVEKPSPSEIAQHPYLLTAKGALSFSQKALDYYLSRHPELRPLADHWAVEEALTVTKEFLRHAEYDGRIHSVISRTAVTGRSRSSSPNIQNIDMGRCRGYLVADEGKVLVELDYSNAENWIAAMYGADSNMALACVQEDFHSAMAEQYFGKDVWQSASPEERKEMRRSGKGITFGTAYGMGPTKLANSLNISFEEAVRLLNNKDLAFPGIAASKEKSAVFADKYGYTRLWSGRRVRIGRDATGRLKSYTAWNSLAQGGVSEIVVRAILQVDAYLREGRSRVASQVHDSLILELDVADYNRVQRVIQFMADIVPPEFNERTTPRIRWLVDLDNKANAKKWGWRFNSDYPLPLDEYVNRWGYHKYPEGASEAPIWINEHGWGQDAIRAELGDDYAPPEVKPRDPVEVDVYRVSGPSFPWSELEQIVKALAGLMTVVEFNGRLFDFSNAMVVREALYHKGHDRSFEQYLTVLDGAAEVFERYKQWRSAS